MANIWMRGFKFPNPILPLRNLIFVQRGLPPLPKGDTGEDTNLAEKTTYVFVGKPTYGGLIQMISTVATTSSKDPTSPGGNKGDGAKHHDHPGGKAAGKAGKDRVSDAENLEKKQEEKNKK